MNPFEEVIDELVLLGRSGEERVPASLLDEDMAWDTLVCGNQPWLQVAQNCGPEDVADLIRGLILYCRASGRSIGGSVSPVIVLYRSLIERVPEWEPPLTRWIVDNRTNPYEPFGTLNDEGATTYGEYVERREARVQRARANEAAEVERQQEAIKIRVTRERDESTQRLAGAVRRGDLRAVQALLRKGADAARALPEGESLVTLAEENGRYAVAAFLKTRGIA
jgi:hypothetical protein